MSPTTLKVDSSLKKSLPLYCGTLGWQLGTLIWIAGQLSWQNDEERGFGDCNLNSSLQKYPELPIEDRTVHINKTLSKLFIDKSQLLYRTWSSICYANHVLYVTSIKNLLLTGISLVVHVTIINGQHVNESHPVFGTNPLQWHCFG